MRFRRFTEQISPLLISANCPIRYVTCKAVGAKAEEVLGERARDLSVPPDSWTEELLDRHEEMLSKLEALEKAVSPIMERVRKREDLVLVRFTFEARVPWSNHLISVPGRSHLICKRCFVLPRLPRSEGGGAILPSFLRVKEASNQWFLVQ